MAGTKLPVVCIFGAAGVELRSSQDAPEYETTALDCRCLPDDADLDAVLIRHRPHVVITIGREADYPRLMAAPFEVRRRWLHYPDLSDPARIGSDAFLCYLAVCLDRRPEAPLVSVFTPTYRTGKRFARTFDSVRAQTYDNWEWVVWDDSDDDGRTHAMLRGYAARDHRLRVIRPERPSGVIGAVKYEACMACRGDILVELDHDDELMPDALAHIVDAARQHPDCGFFYSDFAEVGPALEPLRYPDGWGYGYGSYRAEVVRGVTLAVANAPNINAKTIRGLVAAPNHLRAWRRETYLRLGGHNRLLPVADDMELLVRTFLDTTMVRIPRLLYLQYQEGGNTQRVRNKDIQRHVRYLKWKYDRRIHDRFVALGVDDWIWDEARGFGDMDRPNPAVEPTASLVAGSVPQRAAPAAVVTPSAGQAQSVCLSMIVKNEAPVVARCLASVRPFVTHWIVVDTGSTDGTQEVVREAMQGVPGALHERPWQDFAHNRTEALELARPRGEYVLVIDADDTLEADPGFRLPALEADSYVLQIADGPVAYERPQIVRSALPWRWRGVLHEFLHCDGARASGRLQGLRVRRNHDGARRRDPDTYRRDAAVLEEVLRTESDPQMLARYRFYLAQSYRDGGETEKAVEHYLARGGMGFWEEETFVSLLNAARLMGALGRPFEEVLTTYERASAACPRRVEALHGAALLCFQGGRYREGLEIAGRGLDLTVPPGGLFVEPWIYEYGLLDIYTGNAYRAGEYRICLDACLGLLGGSKLPADLRGKVVKNARLALRKLARAPHPTPPDPAPGEAGFVGRYALGPAISLHKSIQD